MSEQDGWTYCDIGTCTHRTRLPARDGWSHVIGRDICPECRASAPPRPRRVTWHEPALPGLTR